MNSALFLLLINMAIGLSFAAGFVALSRHASTRLGQWCAAGFLAASATAATEAFGFIIASPRLISTLSFGFLMLAAVLIVAGLRLHYRPGASNRTLCAFGIAMTLLNPLVIYDLHRGSYVHALAYQLPFAGVFAFGCISMVRRARRPIDVTVGIVLAAIALHFLAKATLGPILGGHHAPGVRDYIFSLYAYYSQTLGSILSLALGLSLLGLLTVEVMAEHAQRLQRDALSGLRNRSAFFTDADLALRHLPKGQIASVMICDLDHFKSVNDRFGHAAGDEVIARFGALLGEIAGSDGIAGRIGGEEFCLFLPAGDLQRSTAKAKRLRTRLAASRFQHIPADIAVTASFGIATITGHEALADALRRADLALYQAKSEGRNDTRVAPPATGI